MDVFAPRERRRLFFSQTTMRALCLSCHARFIRYLCPGCSISLVLKASAWLPMHDGPRIVYRLMHIYQLTWLEQD